MFIILVAGATVNSASVATDTSKSVLTRDAWVAWAASASPSPPADFTSPGALVTLSTVALSEAPAFSNATVANKFYLATDPAQRRAVPSLDWPVVAAAAATEAAARVAAKAQRKAHAKTQKIAQGQVSGGRQRSRKQKRSGITNLLVSGLLD